MYPKHELPPDLDTSIDGQEGKDTCGLTTCLQKYQVQTLLKEQTAKYGPSSFDELKTVETEKFEEGILTSMYCSGFEKCVKI